MVVQESKSVPSNPFEAIRPGSAHQVSWDPVGLTSWYVDDSVSSFREGGRRASSVSAVLYQVTLLSSAEDRLLA